MHLLFPAQVSFGMKWMVLKNSWPVIASLVVPWKREDPLEIAVNPWAHTLSIPALRLAIRKFRYWLGSRVLFASDGIFLKGRGYPDPGGQCKRASCKSLEAEANPKYLRGCLAKPYDAGYWQSNQGVLEESTRDSRHPYLALCSPSKSGTSSTVSWRKWIGNWKSICKDMDEYMNRISADNTNAKELTWASLAQWRLPCPEWQRRDHGGAR